MKNSLPIPANLLNFYRENTVDMQFFGFIQHFSEAKLIQKIGEDNSYPFFLRSLAKPIQASVLLDFKTDEHFSFTKSEIAIFCASHTAQPYHIKLVKSVLKKIGLSENSLQCGIHAPFAPRKSKLNTQIHNNCSGKHVLMLALCVQNGWSVENYLETNHPLQKIILQKHIELSACNNPIPSLDGCGAPIYGLPLKNIAQAFCKLFSHKKYEIIKNSFLHHPKIIGGENRLDTKIMELAPNLIAKVGAGGFLMVFNTEKNECLLIKLSQDNNTQREIAASFALLQLEWIKCALLDYNNFNLHLAKIGKYKSNFNLIQHI